MKSIPLYKFPERSTYQPEYSGLVRRVFQLEVWAPDGTDGEILHDQIVHQISDAIKEASTDQEPVQFKDLTPQ